MNEQVIWFNHSGSEAEDRAEIGRIFDSLSPGLYKMMCASKREPGEYTEARFIVHEDGRIEKIAPVQRMT